MYEKKRKKNMISIIGIRAFPHEFIGTSGVEFYADKLINQMLKMGDLSFVLYTRSQYQDIAQKSYHKNIKIIAIYTFSHKLFETFIYSLVATILATFDSNSNIIWYHGVGPACWSWIPRLFGKKIILTVHSLDWKRKKWTMLQRKIFYQLGIVSIKCAHKITCVSSRVISELNIFTDKKIIFTPAGIEVISENECFHLKKHIPHSILFLGRIVPEKRLEWLLFATKIISKHIPDLRIIIMGGGSHSTKYMDALKTIYRSKNIFWLGYHFGKYKSKILKASQVLVIPSELEGLPIVVLEKINNGGLVLVGDNCIDNELVQLKNVHIFNTNSFYSFVSQLCLVLKNERRHSDFKGIETLNNIGDFSWPKTAKTFMSIFLKM